MVGIITWLANYRACPGSRMHLSNSAKSRANQSFFRDLEKNVVIDQMETETLLAGEAGPGKGPQKRWAQEFTSRQF